MEETIRRYPRFKTTYSPMRVQAGEAGDIIERMVESSEICDVGPMAAVAGAFADCMEETMRSDGSLINVVEDGGELIIYSVEDIIIALYSLTTILKGNIGFKYKGRS
ncbi:MAG: hypothetical protein ACTSXF_14645, partial [Promethearchaeota archaeon]